MEKFELALNELDAAELASVMGGKAMMNVHQVAPMQYDKNGNGIGDCKLAATFNEFDSK